MRSFYREKNHSAFLNVVTVLPIPWTMRGMHHGIHFFKGREQSSDKFLKDRE